jgi:hypothetical protein
MSTQLEKIQEYYTRRHVGKKIAKSYKKKAKIENIKNYYDELENIIFNFVNEDDKPKSSDNENYNQKKAIQISYSEKSKIKKQIQQFKELAKTDVIYRIINNLATRARKKLKKKESSQNNVSYGLDRMRTRRIEKTS